MPFLDDLISLDIGEISPANTYIDSAALKLVLTFSDYNKEDFQKIISLLFEYNNSNSLYLNEHPVMSVNLDEYINDYTFIKFTNIPSGDYLYEILSDSYRAFVLDDERAKTSLSNRADSSYDKYMAHSAINNMNDVLSSDLTDSKGVITLLFKFANLDYYGLVNAIIQARNDGKNLTDFDKILEYENSGLKEAGISFDDFINDNYNRMLNEENDNNEIYLERLNEIIDNEENYLQLLARTTELSLQHDNLLAEERIQENLYMERLNREIQEEEQLRMWIADLPDINMFFDSDINYSVRDYLDDPTGEGIKINKKLNKKFFVEFKKHLNELVYIHPINSEFKKIFNLTKSIEENLEKFYNI